MSDIFYKIEITKNLLTSYFIWNKPHWNCYWFHVHIKKYAFIKPLNWWKDDRMSEILNVNYYLNDVDKYIIYDTSVIEVQKSNYWNFKYAIRWNYNFIWHIKVQSIQKQNFRLEKAHFFDKSSKLFGHMLNFYRTGIASLSDNEYIM